jgi:hypothetical protein
VISHVITFYHLSFLTIWQERDQNTQDHARSSDENFTDEDKSSAEVDSDDEEEVVLSNLQAYQFDPIMTPERRSEKEEEKKRKEAELAKRSQPLHVWCTCENCTIMPSTIENICCSEDIYVQDMLSETDLKCISAHEGFQPTVLNVHVLNMTRQRLKGLVKDPEKLQKLKSDNNDTYRFLAYSNFRHWVCGESKMGKGNRVVTPACVVKQIRDTWPSIDGQYTGFHSRHNALEDI